MFLFEKSFFFVNSMFGKRIHPLFNPVFICSAEIKLKNSSHGFPNTELFTLRRFFIYK
mgnify:CR=1 FL=1